jgi:hypothetical protein
MLVPAASPATRNDAEDVVKNVTRSGDAGYCAYWWDSS